MRSWAAGDGGRDSFGDRWPRGQTRGAGMTSGPSGGRPVALPCRSTSGNKENSVRTRHVMLLLAGLLLASTAQAADTDAWKLPIATKTLDNGLTVVVSEDHGAPVVGVSVVYHVGMRLEPRDRTGFAHLFEQDRKRVVQGRSVAVRVDLGGRRIIKKKKQ